MIIKCKFYLLILTFFFTWTARAEPISNECRSHQESTRDLVASLELAKKTILDQETASIDSVDSVFSPLICNRVYRLDLILSDYIDQIEFGIQQAIDTSNDLPRTKAYLESAQSELHAIIKNSPLSNFILWDLKLNELALKSTELSSILRESSVRLYDSQGFVLQNQNQKPLAPGDFFTKTKRAHLVKYNRLWLDAEGSLLMKLSQMTLGAYSTKKITVQKVITHFEKIQESVKNAKINFYEGLKAGLEQLEAKDPVPGLRVKIIFNDDLDPPLSVKLSGPKAIKQQIREAEILFSEIYSRMDRNQLLNYVDAGLRSQYSGLRLPILVINGVPQLALTPSFLVKNLEAFQDVLRQFDFQEIIRLDLKYLTKAKDWIWGRLTEINETISQDSTRNPSDYPLDPTLPLIPPLTPPLPQTGQNSSEGLEYFRHFLIKYHFNLLYGYQEIQENLAHLKKKNQKNWLYHMSKVIRFIYGTWPEVNILLQSKGVPLTFSREGEPQSKGDFKRFREQFISILSPLIETYPERPWESKRIVLHTMSGKPIYLVGFPLKQLFQIGDLLEEQMELGNLLPNVLGTGVGAATGNPLFFAITRSGLRNILKVIDEKKTPLQALARFGFETALDLLFSLGFGGMPFEWGYSAFKGAASGATQAILVGQPLGPSVITGALIGAALYYLPAELSVATVGDGDPKSLIANALIEISQDSFRWTVRSYLTDIIADLTDQADPDDHRSIHKKALRSAITGAGVASAFILFTGPRTSVPGEATNELLEFLRREYNRNPEKPQGVTYHFDRNSYDRFSYRDGRTSIVGLIIGKNSGSTAHFNQESGMALNSRGLTLQVQTHEFHHQEQVDTRNIGPMFFLGRYLRHTELPHDMRPLEDNVNISRFFK